MESRSTARTGPPSGRGSTPRLPHTPRPSASPRRPRSWPYIPRGDAKGAEEAKRSSKSTKLDDSHVLILKLTTKLQLSRQCGTNTDHGTMKSQRHTCTFAAGVVHERPRELGRDTFCHTRRGNTIFTGEITKLDPYLTPCAKIPSQWMTELMQGLKLRALRGQHRTKPW